MRVDRVLRWGLVGPPHDAGGVGEDSVMASMCGDQGLALSLPGVRDLARPAVVQQLRLQLLVRFNLSISFLILIGSLGVRPVDYGFDGNLFVVAEFHGQGYGKRKRGQEAFNVGQECVIARHAQYNFILKKLDKIQDWPPAPVGEVADKLQVYFGTEYNKNSAKQ